MHRLDHAEQSRNRGWVARVWVLVALFVIALFAFRRSVGPGRRMPPRRGDRSDRGDAPATLACVECGTRYDPNLAGGVCPRCKK